MVRYDIEIEAASLHAAAALMAGPSHRGSAAEAGALAALANSVLAACYSEDAGALIPLRPQPEAI